MLQIKEVKNAELQKPQNRRNRVQEYVDHFSHIADFVGQARVGELTIDLAAAIRS